MVVKNFESELHKDFDYPIRFPHFHPLVLYSQLELHNLTNQESDLLYQHKQPVLACGLKLVLLALQLEYPQIAMQIHPWLRHDNVETKFLPISVWIKPCLLNFHPELMILD